jgi:hypothetical protein
MIHPVLSMIEMEVGLFASQKGDKIHKRREYLISTNDESPGIGGSSQCLRRPSPTISTKQTPVDSQHPWRGGGGEVLSPAAEQSQK